MKVAPYILGATAGLFLAGSASAKDAQCTVTTRLAEAVQLEMTYAEVKKALGCKGEKTGSEPPFFDEEYTWQGKNQQGKLVVRFKKKLVVSRTYSNLD